MEASHQVHDWRRNSNEIGSGRNGGRIGGNLCWGGGGADSTPSPFSSWTIVGGGEVALGGLSLKESPPGSDDAGREGTLAAFLLLKDTTPSESSSSERISKTLFPLSRGVGARDEATASGTAAMGGGELGV